MVRSLSGKAARHSGSSGRRDIRFLSGARAAESCASGLLRTSSPLRSVTEVDEVESYVSYSLP
ncbi:hypothetical protein AUI46_01065 [archaeon 13_1_40CM_2_52_13]|nr:MAG: hypothetical protein AUI46_01065 [archaeon 13_1_40CM_2_52_13]